MGIFILYAIILIFSVYTISKKLYLINPYVVTLTFGIQVVFIAVVSYVVDTSQYSFLRVLDEDNYFHDAILFNHLAHTHPLYYFMFLLDIEPENREIFNQYFTMTNAWSKAPEFFYNDNKLVIKIHSLLAFVSGYHVSVHRLLSALMSLSGWYAIFYFFIKLWNIYVSKYFQRYGSYVFMLSYLMPAFLFFTSFVMKESILILLMGGIALVLYQWIIEKKYRIKNIFIGVILMMLSFLFRPAYLLSFIFFTATFLFVRCAIKKYPIIVYVSILCLAAMMLNFILYFVFNKSALDIVQYRQERFLDASQGGIFLSNTRMFVRVPYNWENLKWDSTQKMPEYYIKPNVKLMYWYLTNLNDTIIEYNKDTTEAYHLLYAIEKANRTVYIQKINTQKDIAYNFQSILEAVNVFFFYPKEIKNIADIVVWIENILILILMMILLLQMVVEKNKLVRVYVWLMCVCIILIISLCAPNTGAIIRYRYFILPILFLNVLLPIIQNHIDRLKDNDKYLSTNQ